MWRYISSLLKTGSITKHIFPGYKEEGELAIFLSLQVSPAIKALSVVVYGFEHINALLAYYIINF